MKRAWQQLGAGFLLGAVIFACIAADTVSKFPSISLGGTTNVLSDNGTALTRNGVPVGGGGGDSVWTNATDNLATLINTNAAAIIGLGGIAIGQTTLDWWGSPINALLFRYDQTIGEPSETELNLTNLDATRESTVDLYARAGVAGLNLFGDNGTRIVKTLFNAEAGTPVILYQDGEGNTPLYVNPEVGEDASSIAYKLSSKLTLTDARLLAVQNNAADRLWVTASGVTASTNGVASGAVNASTAIATGGWTNTFGKNATVFVEGIGVVYTIYNNAGTAVYTNVTAQTSATIPLQVNGKVLVTAGSAITGRAIPW